MLLMLNSYVTFNLIVPVKIKFIPRRDLCHLNKDPEDVQRRSSEGFIRNKSGRLRYLTYLIYF